MTTVQALSSTRRSGVDSTGTAFGLEQYLQTIGRHELLTSDEEVELAQVIEAALAAERTLALRPPKSDREHLERAVARGAEAKDRFVAANLRLVVAMARRYVRRNGNLDLLDLIQEGNVGLIRAVEKYDWRKGFKFSTYATWWIRQAIGRAIAEKSRVVRLPSALHDSIGVVKATQASIMARTGRKASAAEIAAESGLSPDTVDRVLATAESISLDQPVGEDGAILGDFVEDDDADDPERTAERSGVGSALRQALRRLPAREARILDLRYGFADDIPHTHEEIGLEFDLTRERISQIEKVALSRLRHPSFGLREADLV